MIKLASASLLALAVSASASPNNKALGTKLGDTLAAASADPSFAAGFDPSFGMPVMVNPAVSEWIRAANAKAAKMSFLKAPSSINLMVADDPNYSAAAASELGYQQRKKLLSIMAGEAAAKETLASLSGSAAKYEAGSSFLMAPAESAAAVLSDAQYQASQFDYLKTSISSYISSINAGGYTAQRAIAALTNAVAEPNAKTTSQLMSPPLLRALRNLMLKESTPDQLRTAAGSIITQITNMPVSTTSVDTTSGSYGHVNIVMPAPSRVYAADERVLSSKAGRAAFLQQRGIFQLPEELLGDVNKGPASLNVLVQAGEDSEGAEILKSLRA